MRRDQAEEISQALLSCAGQLDQSVALLQGVLDEDHFNEYRRLVGQVLALLYIDVLRDLFREYPDLELESMR